jgi:hypothetical protein
MSGIESYPCYTTKLLLLINFIAPSQFLLGQLLAAAVVASIVYSLLVLKVLVDIKQFIYTTWYSRDAMPDFMFKPSGTFDVWYQLWITCLPLNN